MPPSQETAGCFVAYASQPPLRAETMRDAITRVQSFGIEAEGWEDLEIEGKVLINKISERIDAHTSFIAETSSLNGNVLFEVGYAIARNKVVWLLHDETDTTATKNWASLSLLSTVARYDYSGNSEKLAAKIARQAPHMEEPSLLDTLLAGGAPREDDVVFAPSLPTKFTAAMALERMLERHPEFNVRGASDDLGLAPLDFYVKEIYRSSAAIFHLLAPNRVRAEEHNARASLLAGIAYGFDLPLLMVVESGFQSPLDYRDMLHTYTSSAELQSHVSTWLQNIPKTQSTKKRPGRLALNIELPIRSFGQYVAEYETNDLDEYFIETSEFQSILDGTAKVFIGRKGTGKTATMSQAVIELRKDRRNLVIPIKPSSYELSGLIEAVSSFKNDSSSQYFILTLWSYLITTEIALRLVSHARDLPAGISEATPQRDLELELEALGVNTSDNLATRLEGAVGTFLNTSPISGETEQQYISRNLRAAHITKLQKKVHLASREYSRIAVLIDNLDKTWERGSDYSTISKFILGLLAETGKFEKEFSRSDLAGKSSVLTLAIFLRTDIFDVISPMAREPDKIGALSVHWRDEELLARVLEERYVAKRPSRAQINSDVWKELFAPEVRGQTARDYLLWRTLPRPRDLIYFANAALTTAVNRRHNMVQESDVVFADGLYSKFAFDALLVESEAQGFDLEEALYEFAGLNSTLDELELQSVLSPSGRHEEITAWLVRTSFLGVEVEDGSFVHVEGEESARRKLRVARRLSERLSRPLRYRVHPAFRNHLDVHDDDLHSPDIRDATLT